MSDINEGLVDELLTVIKTYPEMAGSHKLVCGELRIGDEETSGVLSEPCLLSDLLPSDVVFVLRSDGR